MAEQLRHGGHEARHLADYVTERRADVLDAKRLSDNTVQALSVVALTSDSCEKVFFTCADTLAQPPGLNEEQRLSALSELWLAKAIKSDHPASDGAMGDATLDAFLQSARYAYAYPFYTARKPSECAFELRQVQVIDFYNFRAAFDYTILQGAAAARHAVEPDTAGRLDGISAGNGRPSIYLSI